jgi:hypothetical protein
MKVIKGADKYLMRLNKILFYYKTKLGMKAIKKMLCFLVNSIDNKQFSKDIKVTPTCFDAIKENVNDLIVK